MPIDGGTHQVWVGSPACPPNGQEQDASVSALVSSVQVLVLSIIFDALGQLSLRSGLKSWEADGAFGDLYGKEGAC